MFKKALLSFMLILVLPVLCSCHFISFDADSLLSPPKLSVLNQAIQKAMSQEIGSGYDLVYPQSGNNRTAIISVDLDNDGQSETVCFYRSKKDGKLGLIALYFEQDSWKTLSTFTSDATTVDKVEFADLNGDGNREIIVGWQYLSGKDNAIEVLSFKKSSEAKKFKSEYTGVYNQFVICDDFYTSRSGLVIVSKNAAYNTSMATLVGQKDQNIGIINTVPLNDMVQSYVSIQVSRTTQKQVAIYLDERLDSLMYETEILMINEQGELQNVSLSQSNDLSRRSGAVTCQDINGDGSLDVPLESNLPRYTRNGVSENLTLTIWCQFDGRNFQRIVAAFTSVTERFYIEFPDAWIGNVTVERDETNERTYHFYHYNEDTKTPMFDIRVFSQLEFSDTASSSGWESIKSASDNIYAFEGYQNGLSDEYQVDLARVSELFKLLSDG